MIRIIRRAAVQPKPAAPVPTRHRPAPRVAAALVAVLLIGISAPLAAQDSTGVWRTEATDEGYLEIAVAPCGPAVCGKILRARDLQGTEQPYEHTGRQMIWDMVADGPASWADGRIWDPRNDRTFNSRMQLSGDGLRVSGCFMGICQHQLWQRVR